MTSGLAWQPVCHLSEIVKLYFWDRKWEAVISSLIISLFAVIAVVRNYLKQPKLAYF